MGKRRKSVTRDPVLARVESLDSEGRGVGRVEGRTVFIDGALPGEEVLIRYRYRRGRFDVGSVVDVLKQAPDRVSARCPHVGLCGGCSLQHLEPGAQVRFKEARLLDSLSHQADVEPETLLQPLVGPRWGYRRKARLGVKYVAKKDAVLVGFREKGSSFVADLSRCDVLHPSIGSRLKELRSLLCSLEAYRQIPQVEVAGGDEHMALVFRHLAPLSDADCQALQEFAAAHDYWVYVQSGGPGTVELLHPRCGEPELAYELPQWRLAIQFAPTDFTQVNGEMNRRMVALVLKLLDSGSRDRVLDLFCGLGNFTLPLARVSCSVVGVEGDAGLVARARENARVNGVDNVEFVVDDLLNPVSQASWWRNGYHKLVLDPPRIGALQLLASLQDPYPERIVYVSCNPATLARDAGKLVHSHGYRLVCAGVVDMFPHTSHIESIALFQH